MEIPKKFKTISNKEMDMIIFAKKYCWIFKDCDFFRFGENTERFIFFSLGKSFEQLKSNGKTFSKCYSLDSLVNNLTRNIYNTKCNIVWNVRIAKNLKSVETIGLNRVKHANIQNNVKNVTKYMGAANVV